MNPLKLIWPRVNLWKYQWLIWDLLSGNEHLKSLLKRNNEPFEILWATVSPVTTMRMGKGPAVQIEGSFFTEYDRIELSLMGQQILYQRDQQP